MRKILLIALALAMVLAMGCGKKEPAEKPAGGTGSKAGTHGKVRVISLCDPVDSSAVDVKNAPTRYFHVYNGVEYNFSSKENMEAFIKDPEKYVGKKK